MPPAIEVRSANERGNSMSWSPNFLRGVGAVDHGPVDHHLLRADARPFHEGDRDAPVAAGGDRLEHALVGDRGGVAFALQLELGLIDAARHVGGEHQQQIDLFGGLRDRRRQESAEQSASSTSNDRNARSMSAPPPPSRPSKPSLADFQRRAIGLRTRPPKRRPPGRSAAAGASTFRISSRKVCAISSSWGAHSV